MSPFFLALVLTDVLLLGILVGLPVRAYWAMKVIAIVVVLSFNFLAWSSAGSGTGWPVRAGLPAKAQFISCQVVEPQRIYVWVVPLDFHHGVLSYRNTEEEPRAYSEPYDQSLYQACVSATKLTRAGYPAGIKSPAKGTTHGHPGQTSRGKYVPYLLPSVNLPRKDR